MRCCLCWPREAWGHIGSALIWFLAFAAKGSEVLAHLVSSAPQGSPSGSYVSHRMPKRSEPLCQSRVLWSQPDCGHDILCSLSLSHNLPSQSLPLPPSLSRIQRPRVCFPPTPISHTMNAAVSSDKSTHCREWQYFQSWQTRS